MQIRFFAPNNLNPVEIIQADVIPPVGSLITTIRTNWHYECAKAFLSSLATRE